LSSGFPEIFGCVRNSNFLQVFPAPTLTSLESSTTLCSFEIPCGDVLWDPKVRASAGEVPRKNHPPAGSPLNGLLIPEQNGNSGARDRG